MRYLPETMGPGVAFLDYDNDGWMDLYLVNSGPCDFWTPPRPVRSALYRNNRDGTFTDVTDKAGVGANTFGMGAAVGDYDNDGFPDIFVSAYGRPILYHNNGDGTFTDVSEKSGLGARVFEGHWTTSAVWFDFDNDGRLDLFTCSFVDYGEAHHLSCGDNKLGRHFYCIPRAFKATANLLFHNNGDGTFTEVGRGTRIEKALGKGLGVVATDVNNDGLMDLFVANDTVQNFLFVNRGKDAHGHTEWEEAALSADVGFSDSGQARSGMGVDSADFDGDGYLDLLVANVDQEKFALYKNNKDETFADVAYTQNIAQTTRLLSGWGLKFFDYDNDGFLDLIFACGHPDDMIDHYSQQVRYREPLLLFHQKDGVFRNVSADGGSAFSRVYSARGLAIGDYNNDGRVDLMIGNNGGAPLLMRNQDASGNHWLGLKLEGTGCNRDAIGARITWCAGGVQHSRLKTNGGSYLSSHDPRPVLGIGTASKIDWVEIRWPLPSGKVQRLKNLPVDTYVTIKEPK